MPDLAGAYDGIICWECLSCGDAVWATGYFEKNSVAMSPDEWQRIAERERRIGTALGRAAAQAERHHVLATDRYDTFAQST